MYLNTYLSITASLHNTVLYNSVKCNQLLYNHIAFFPYHSKTLGILFLYLLMNNCVDNKWNMKDKWIFPLTLCESPCPLADALMYKHFLLKAVFPKLLKLEQFPISCMSILWPILSEHLWFTVLLHFVSNFCYINFNCIWHITLLYCIPTQIPCLKLNFVYII